MKKVILDSNARFKLERLCDGLYPQEVGGWLFGPQTSEIIWINDIFPVANVAENKNNTFKEHDWGNYWRDIYGIANNSKWLGTFHSHPNGQIPSEQDMKAYNDSNLHLWIIHHTKGEHTFQASLGLNHVNLELAAMPVRETLKPELTDNGFRLGEINISDYGKLETDTVSILLLKLDEKQRMVYLAILKVKDRWDDFIAKDVAQKLNICQSTTNKHLKSLARLGMIKKTYGRQRWKVKKLN